MLRLAFDFIITWRETRTRPNAYSVFIMVCISSFVIYPLSTLSGELIYPAKGLNGRRPSFLAIEMMCFNTIM